MYRLWTQIVSLCMVAMFLGGCAAWVSSPVPGWIYTDVEGPINATSIAKTTRTGKSCAESYLGLVALGDASIDAAKRAGQIQEVSSVDHESFNVLGIYARYCTVARGT
jgi:TRL-like protein family